MSRVEILLASLLGLLLQRPIFLHSRCSWLMLALFVLLIHPALWTLAAQDPAEKAVPVITIVGSEVDYGELLQGEVVEREFEVRNDGTAPLNIWRAIASCSCTKILDFPRTLAPGASGKVKFEIDSKKIKPGDTRKGITLENDDLEQSKIRFIFKAKITSLFRTDPNPILVTGLYRNEKKAQVRLLAATDLGFNILGARSRNGEFEITDFEEVTKDGEYRIEVTVPPSDKPRIVKDPLDLMIEVKDGRSVVVGRYVEVHHLESIQVRPERVLQFGNKDTDRLLEEGSPGTVTKMVQLINIDPDLDLKIQKATLEGMPEGVILTTVTEVVPGKNYRVLLTLTEYRSEPILRGKLVIETNDPANKSRVIQVAARFGRR
ncbi:MAG: hypothetical protein CBC13_05015 [Planctomycetia bacterium TMED53]|nr:MAG: hypothetical protein CBC13_05015 [Planctomycetia bacterium TMED53]